MGLIGPIECQSIEEMKSVMDTNFFGLVRLMKEILPDMKRRKKGHIVVISSVMGIQGKSFFTCWSWEHFLRQLLHNFFPCFRDFIQRYLRSI